MQPVVQRILAPVDLAESREPELGYALSLAAQLRAELLLLAVIDTPATLNLIGHHGSAGRGGNFEAELQEEVQSQLENKHYHRFLVSPLYNKMMLDAEEAGIDFINATVGELGRVAAREESAYLSRW